jgi:hypothetical protein
MKHKYRIKVVTKVNEPTRYYPQVKKWYGWCYFHSPVSSAGGMTSERVFYYNKSEAEQFIIQKIYSKQKPIIKYITPEL